MLIVSPRPYGHGRDHENGHENGYGRACGRGRGGNDRGRYVYGTP